MKFTFIANNDFDGVGQTAVNLSNNLNLMGQKCEVLVLHKKFKNNNTTILKRSLFKRLLLFFFNFLKKDFNELFGIGYSVINFDYLKKKLIGTDVVVIFTFYKVISNDQLEKIFNLNKIVYLRPLDIEMATGGCHFNNFCVKFKNSCNNCPKFNFSNWVKFPEINLSKKKKIIKKYKPRVLVQNKYVKSIFDQSNIFKKIKKDILYIGTNAIRSKKISKDLAKKYLGINKNEKIVLFATFNLNSSIKGGHLLKESIKILDNDKKLNNKIKIRFLTLGNKNGFDIETKNIKWTHLGVTKSNQELNYILRASDTMVCPSLFCFGPHIVEEALLNEVPVVAFNLGSAQEFVKNGLNGYLIKKYDTRKYANAIKKIITKEKFVFSKLQYKIVKEKCSADSEVRKLVGLAQEDLDKKIV